MRFQNIKFQVATAEEDLNKPESLCNEQVESLAPGAVKFYPCLYSSMVAIDGTGQEVHIIEGRFVRVWQAVTNEILHFKEAAVHAIKANTGT